MADDPKPFARALQALSKAKGIGAPPEQSTARRILEAITGYPAEGTPSSGWDVMLAALPFGGLAKKLAKPIRAYHGTSAADTFQTFKTPEAYFTVDPREAAAYATDPIIGGSRRAGRPRIVEAELPPGKGWDINRAVESAIADGDDVDAVIASYAAKARQSGVDYLTFKHPSSHGQDYIDAIVSLRPEQVKIDPPAFTARNRADGRVDIVGPSDQAAGVYHPNEVEESLSNLEFGYRRARPQGRVDPATIEILRKYGLLPAAVGAGAAPSLYGQEQK